MTDPSVAIAVRDLHGEGMATRPARNEPVDELFCDECRTAVGLVSRNLGTPEKPIIRVDFHPYQVSQPHDVVVIFCESDAE